MPSHLYLARALTQVGLTSLAIHAYRDALAADPACFEACFGMGEALARARRWDAAVDVFRAAAILRPGDAETQGNLVLALYRSGRIRHAASAMRRLIDLRPQEPELYMALGAIQCRLRRPWEAIRTFRWAARLAAPATTKRFLLGEALVGERHWMEAVGHLEAARHIVALAAPVPRYRNARATLASRRKRLAALLEAPVRPPVALSSAFCRLVAGGHLLAARALARSQPDLAIRSVRAARRLGAA